MRYKTERELQSDTLLKEGDYRSIKDMLERINRYIPDQKILAELNESNEIVFHTASDIYEEVMNLGDGLLEAGLENKHIAIISENCYRYIIADICISSGVGVVTPIDVNAPAELMTMLLNKCDADAVLCGAGQVDMIKGIMKDCPRLQSIITIDRKKDNLPSYTELVECGRKVKNNSRYRSMDLDLAAPAKILFTSGTTGPIKV
jgi:long-chain acyl-CoA synthetase